MTMENLNPKLNPLVRIVDDDERVRQSEAFVLRLSGWDVKEYESAERFLESDDKERCGCLVLDIRMPGLSGIELQKELIRQGRTIPILFLTGHGDLDMAVAALKRGAADFVQKPIRSETLTESVKRLVAWHEAVCRKRIEAKAAADKLRTLTPKELEICREAASGLHNKEIAEKLGVTEQTVKIHRWNATPMLRWLESQGMKFMPSVTEAYGAEWPRAHKPLMPNGEGYIRTLSNRASALGAEIRTGTAAVALLQSDGRVTGVRVNDRGTLRNLNAKKGVILSSGGFGANREMIHRFAPKYDGLTTNAAPGSTGEMILEAEKIGSSLTDMDRILCNPGPPEGRTHHARFHMIVDQFILVNHQGRRFIREDAHRNQLTDAVLKLPERYAYTVIDDRAFRNLSILMQKEATLAIETGDAWCADTVPELASLMGLPKGNLARTVEQYNRSVKTRQDPLGKAASALKSPILKPPFWGCYAGMSTLYTLGGVRISPQARVLTALGKPIPGLWASGEVTGGVHGVNRLGGCGIPDGLVFGRIAGLDAAGIKS